MCELGYEIPYDFVECFEAVDKSLLLHLIHRVFSIANFDWDLYVFEFIEIYFSNNFTVVFIAVGFGVDKFGSMSGIGTKT